jgi:uncharacterized membrane protein
MKHSAIELLWLLLFFVAIFLGIYMTVKQGISQSYPLLIISIVSILMYLLRRYIRKLKEQSNQE